MIMRIQTKSPRKPNPSDADYTALTQTRPKTSKQTLQLKKWRSTKFHSGGTASKREVELLGEWLNSVLAENLDQTENPIDVVTNAQHWYSVAFNELVRQVSIACTERGRLFAVIWKRNQDLFSKMIELHKNEREYILKIHKERVQFLKTDLEFSNSRLNTISEAYNEEQKRWSESAERDVTKFDALQQKINIQISERAKLMQELNELKTKLGLPINTPIKEKDDEIPNVYTLDNLNTKLREAQVTLRDPKKFKLENINRALTSLDLYLHRSIHGSLNYRTFFEYCFLSLPKNYTPTIRKPNWLNAAITFIYTDYLSALNKVGPKAMLKKTFIDFCLDSFILLFGSRPRAEKTLLDLIATVYDVITPDEPSSRYVYFLNFLGLKNPLSVDTLHFYLYTLSVMMKHNQGPLFPELEASEEMICAVPTSTALVSANEVLERLVSGRMLKFYTQRIEKVANSGALRFGGRQIAELDEILEYMVTFYSEETKTLEDNMKDLWNKCDVEEITTFTQFRQLMSSINNRLTSTEISKMYVEHVRTLPRMTLQRDDFLNILRKYNYIVPLQLTPDDFPRTLAIDDMVPFIQLEFADVVPLYEKTMERLTQFGDEMTAKSLKAAKTKYEQSITGHCTAKIFESNIRDFFERLDLANSS